MRNKCEMTLSPGLYRAKGHSRIGILANQTKCYATFVELYNPTTEEYCCEGEGLRHPAVGFTVMKYNAIKLRPEEISSKMRKQWQDRLKQACGYMMSPACVGLSNS